jgi:toxin-antitoxin system PIN domain toxin
MKIVDTNVLLYSVNEESRDHEWARAWVEQALSGLETVGFAWLVLVGFLRLSTTRGLLRRPFRSAEALDLVSDWLSAGPSVVIHPTSRHFDILRDLIEPFGGTAGNLVNDAHLAALAVEHGATIVSFDRDFGRFRGVRVEEPASGT